MRVLAWCVAFTLVACGKKSAPAPSIAETNAPPTVVATTAPTTSATASETADASADVEDDADADAEEDDAGAAAWVTAKSTGCLGWNATTRHAVCIVGYSGAGGSPQVHARDMFDDAAPRVDWLDGNTKSGFDGDDPPPAASVAKVAKLVARMHLTPIDPKTARKMGPGEEISLTTPKPLTLRYKRTTHGDQTDDALEVLCNSTTQQLLSASGKTKRMSMTSIIELYVDPTSTMGLIVWAVYRDDGVSASVYHNVFYAQAIDFTAKDYCPQPTLLL